MVVLSKHAVKSKWVAKELEVALAKKKYEILPVRVDEVVAEKHGEPFSQVWNERHVANFSRWKEPRVFGPQFKLLLNELRRE